MRNKAPERMLNEELSAATGQVVVLIEALPIRAGQGARVVFQSSDSPWRQGVRFVTEGVLSANGVEAPQLDIWTDTAPSAVEISCLATDGLLRFYNVWESGRRPGVESRSATSGMVADAIEDGRWRYSCNDIGHDPTFQKLVFQISITQ